MTVLPYSVRSTASAPLRTEQRKVTFSDRDREVVRKHVKARPVERESRTTGSTVRTEIRTGERVPIQALLAKIEAALKLLGA
ncbi:hypothetical protein [Bradyrhizobium manausense]|uniref:Uncharacterized protein n=1 Tax=Bradyrhizobium manausense TaxID=989370 RepID=A0A0R3E2P4_9BRAD|nr:hypothetical protein [Bradyrhizobium manausense]KRQ14701.1 hypothetical protein AOQ71_12515 [Bradyrhizobium manausense]